jgi:4-amino-4-deoxy-L-arabinose transferase-like glycosyltransferase
MTLDEHNDSGFTISPRILSLFTIVFFIIYIPGLLVDVMDVDAAQYASMSREMVETGSWMELHNRYNDYLDKPPLLFWLSSLSMWSIGISNFAYKLPSFLFGVLAVFSTIKLTELIYNRITALLAGLMVASCLGFFIMMNDVRTDTLLMGAFAFSLWQLMLYVKTKSWRALVLGFTGIGLAMLAKGPLGLVMPVFALSCEFAYKRQWVNFVRWQWLVGLVIVAIILTPMCIGLYNQFDAHPEKQINGQTGVSGLEFYFWTQSFGRITGDSDWGTKFDNGATNFFFTHTFMWAFFPWSILTVLGLAKNLFVLVRSRFKPGYLNEMLATGGFVLIFLALSASKYKLPHYIYITFPLAAIIAARFVIADLLQPARKIMAALALSFSLLFTLLLFTVVFLILLFIFPGAGMLTMLIVLLLCFACVAFFLARKTKAERILLPLLVALMAFYYTGFTQFYPELLKYQATNEVGRDIVANNVPRGAFKMHNEVFQHSLDFYSRSSPGYIQIDSAQIMPVMEQYGAVWIYTDKPGYEEILRSEFNMVTVKEYERFSVQFLTFPFLDPAKRGSIVEHVYLVKLQ